MTITANLRLYRGFEIYPLVFPHRATQPGLARDYEAGFDAAVRISELASGTLAARSRVFRLDSPKPFENTGDARRASTLYAEQLIDASTGGESLWDVQ